MLLDEPPSPGSGAIRMLENICSATTRDAADQPLTVIAGSGGTRMLCYAPVTQQLSRELHAFVAQRESLSSVSSGLRTAAGGYRQAKEFIRRFGAAAAGAGSQGTGKAAQPLAGQR